MLMFDLSLREVSRRPGRALLTLASVVLAVSATIAVSLGTAASRNLTKNFRRWAGKGSPTKSCRPTAERFPKR
ncbi:MAG: hypothetical protein QM811_12390 [Pirellulales bacterium]